MTKDRIEQAQWQKKIKIAHLVDPPKSHLVNMTSAVPSVLPISVVQTELDGAYTCSSPGVDYCLGLSRATNNHWMLENP